MSTENELVPTSTEVVEEATQPEVVAPAATDGAETPPEPTKTPEQLELERLRRALTKRDRTQGKMHSELEQLRAQLARQPAPQPETDKPVVPREEVEREAMTLAERIADRKAFNDKCNSVADAGKKDFTDFSAALETLIEEAGPLVNQDGATPLGDLILESESPAALIHYLGKHPEIAGELDGLKPAQLARKLVAIEAQMTAKPKTSAAPKPLEPVKAQATQKDPKDMTDREFANWRRGQIKQR